MDKQDKETEKNDPWVVYVADKSSQSCKNCVSNHGKRFRESDMSRPALPIHPNCKCQYEKLDDKTALKVAMRSATVRVDGTPGIGGIRITGVDDMLDKLEKNYSPGTLHELIISNHGEFPGEFELGSRRERLDKMTPAQIERFKKLLSPKT